MGLETATYINGLVATNPTAGDPKYNGDDHLRLIKSAVKSTLPNLTGPVTASQAELNVLDGITASTPELNILDGATVTATELNVLDGIAVTTAELNTLDGVTAPLQGQINAKAPIVSPAFTGTPTAPTAPLGANTKQIANMEALRAAAFASALPPGIEGQFLSFQGGIWTPTQAPNQVVRLPKNSAYTAVFADRSCLIDCTGTFTLGFDAAATLGNGWFAWVRNSGTGVITLDPNAAETIDGAATTVLHPGEVRMVQGDGAELRTAQLNRGAAGVIHVQDQKPAGTASGTSVVGDQTRTLNTVLTNTMLGASLAANAVTLPPGVYRAEGWASVASGVSRLYLYNETDATILTGGNGTVGGATPTVSGQFTLTATKSISLRQYFGAGTGMGSVINDTRPEIYANLLIEKVA